MLLNGTELCTEYKIFLVILTHKKKVSKQVLLNHKYTDNRKRLYKITITLKFTSYI